MASTTEAHRTGWYYGWNIVVVAVLAQIAANGVPSNCLTLFLRPWSTEFHVPISQLLAATFPMMIFMSVMGAILGPVADKRPARWLLGLGLGGMALLMLACSAATAAWHIEAIYALVLPIPVVLSTAVIANAVVSRWFVKRLGLAIGICSFGIAIAGVVLPPLIAWAMPIIGWRGVWRAGAAIIALVVLPIVVFVMRDRPTEREGLDYVNVPGGATPIAHGHSSGPGGLRTLDILKNANLWFVIAVFAPLGCIFLGGQANLAPIALSRGFGPQTAGMLLSAVAVSHVGSSLLMGLLTDRLGYKLPLAILAFTTAAAGLFLGFGHGLLALVAGAAGAGFAGGIYPVVTAAAATEFGPKNVGRVFGLLMLILPIHPLFSSIIARVKEATGSYGSVFAALSILCVIAGVAALLFTRERRGAIAPVQEETALT